MLFSTTFALVMAFAPAIFAAPTPSQTIGDLERRYLSPDTIRKLEDGVCDLSKAVMPIAPTPLPAVSSGLALAHVAIGRGTQNYTCASSTSTDAPKLQGANATLYNVTCYSVRSPSVLASIPSIALTQSIDLNQDVQKYTVSGHHEFTAAGVPLFLLKADKSNYGYVQAKSAANSTAPAESVKGENGLGSVPWLKLTGVEGDYKEIYRLQTAGGVAPKTCEGQASFFIVQYAAEYWFWK
ncbi:uncharacterized protein N0V89_001087 [Didymosphaeria variabile]|uniref:Malate dehydrogenase n=1 Tax=Didymosphaeria variabile TaxID=1932322 RepID=A0A9W8XY10_9PLEO|nr:uncharacterized protein N0V89_001087 [Didymosphaeria variabile]KAJ4360522.1 hypothetical protein N0V89_001087 [Didymosphaeria variabile]